MRSKKWINGVVVGVVVVCMVSASWAADRMIFMDDDAIMESGRP